MQTISCEFPDEMFHQLIAAANANQISPSDVVCAALTKYFQIGTLAGKPKLTAEIAEKWIGICEGGPPDLSTNPKYMEDFGK